VAKSGLPWAALVVSLAGNVVLGALVLVRGPERGGAPVPEDAAPAASPHEGTDPGLAEARPREAPPAASQARTTEPRPATTRAGEASAPAPPVALARGEGAGPAAPAAGTAAVEGSMTARAPASPPSVPPAAPPAESPAAARARPAAAPGVGAGADLASRQEERSRARKVVDAAKAKVLQIQDARLRAEGFEELAALLAPGSDWASAQAGLQALIEVRAVEYDRERFRELILPWTREGDLETRARALYALFNVKREPEDVRLAIDFAGAVAVAEADLRSTAANLLVFFAGGKVVGDVARAFEPLFEARPDAGGRRDRGPLDVANALRNAEAEPSIQVRVAELWRNRGPQDSILDYVVSQVLRKETPLALACLELLASEGSHRQLAEGRLGAGSRDVAEAARGPLAAAAAERLEKAADPWLQARLLDVIAAHGTTEQAGVVRAFAANPLVTDAVRRKASEVWDRVSMRSRLEPGR
jgi:hypothetical protein